MQILLPPSEGKNASKATLPPLDLSTLTMPELTSARTRVIHTLEALANSGAHNRTIGLAESNTAWKDHNQQLTSAPTMLAKDLYGGVLYKHAQLTEIAPREDMTVHIFSALWGIISPFDAVAPYKLPAKSKLIDDAPMHRYWAKQLPEIDFGEDLILDLRSTDYQKFYQLTAATVRSYKRFETGIKPETHNVKRTRGEFLHALASLEALPLTVEDLKDFSSTFVRSHPDYCGFEALPTKSGTELALILQG